jgi:allophanate hydrolase subunit 2
VSDEPFIAVWGLPAGPAFVQDLGRRGYLAHAVPVGGALIPELLVAANLAVGNAPDAPGLELYGGLEASVYSLEPVMASLDGAPVAQRREGATTTWISIARPKRHRAQYLALTGGVDNGEMLGGRGALAGTSFGAPVRVKGLYLLGSFKSTVRAPRVEAHDDLTTRPIRVIEGPDLHTHFAPGAFELLLRSPWTVDVRSDRAGFRLAGPALPRTRAPEHPQPMVPGAIEVARDGAPVVLGPDGPTTGGYPLVGVVVRSDLGALFARRPGAAVRFTGTTAAAARRP